MVHPCLDFLLKLLLDVLVGLLFGMSAIALDASFLLHAFVDEWEVGLFL